MCKNSLGRVIECFRNPLLIEIKRCGSLEKCAVSRVIAWISKKYNVTFKILQIQCIVGNKTRTDQSQTGIVSM